MTSIDAALADGLALPANFEDLAIEHGVREADMPEVKALSLSVFAHKRLDATGAFAFGAALVALEAYFDEEAFEEFAPKAYEYSLKHVRSYQKVASELGPWRSRAIRVEFTSTHLIRMLPRTPEERDAILAKAEAGEKVTVADVENWGKPEKEAVDPMSSGGLKGLRAQALAKAKVGSASFGANVGTVLAAIDEALASGKSIAKKGLVDQIQKPARQAGGELLNLAQFVAPGPFGDVAPLAFPAESEWGKVHAVLDQVGHEGEWPKKAELDSWLRETVLPILTWAVSGSRPKKAPEAKAEMPVAATEADGPVVETGIVAGPPVKPVEAKAAAKPKRSAKLRLVKSASDEA
ncbi:MAG: hypothetical protein MEQ84_02620 [Mesorhizobium sp.]|nr:hypothetical protein [Mesorhizobium sp.]